MLKGFFDNKKGREREREKQKSRKLSSGFSPEGKANKENCMSVHRSR